jgi:hypothetical protein
VNARKARWRKSFLSSFIAEKRKEVAACQGWEG